MQKNTGKKVVTGLFIAMAVFTVFMIVMTFVNSKKIKESRTINPDEVNLVQLETIKGNIPDDALVAIITTDYGQIRAQLYPEYAPETVANFRRLSDSGYYDGTFVYKIQKDIYLAGGCKYNDGSLPDGYNKDDECIEPEISKDLWPFKGSFMSCGFTRTSFWEGKQIIYSGSRYMVAGSIEYTDEIKNELLEGKQNTKIEEAFIEYGGIPNASQQMTIFAQTYEGFDVLDKLLSLESDAETYKPVQDIEIIKTEVCTYKESLEK
jgi:peptidyl-prolyl cis-trans isomerase B (cyclophilin B)